MDGVSRVAAHPKKMVGIKIIGKTLFRVEINLLGWQKLEIKKNLGQKNFGQKNVCQKVLVKWGLLKKILVKKI